MSPTTRRRALQGAVGLLGALAGCSDIGAGPDPDERRTPTPAADEPDEGGVSTPDHIALRSTPGPRPRAIIWFARDAAAVPTDGGTVSQGQRARSGLIASAAVAETVTVREDRLADSGLSATPEEVRAFLDATDFDSETVYVDRWPVEACYRLELCSAGWDDEEIETQYGRVLRPYDARCAADTRVSRVTLIRFPAALDPEQHRSHSSGVSGDGCSGRGPRAEGDSDAMVATTGGDATSDATGSTAKADGTQTTTETPGATATDGGDR